MDEERVPKTSFARRPAPWLRVLIALTLAVALANATAASGQEVAPGKPLRPQLLLIHGGSFLGDDPGFEALTRGPAAAAGGQVGDEAVGVLEELDGLVEVDDVDAVALGENVRLHLRVPALGLVPEVDAGLQECLEARLARLAVRTGNGGIEDWTRDH